MKTLAFLIPLFAAVFVSAHGAVKDVVSKGQRIRGPSPGNRAKNFATRPVANVDPNYGFDNPALTCGPNSGSVTNSITVAAGDTIQMDWGNWPHNTGPVIDYLADCNGDCARVSNPAQLRFFKIAEKGTENGGPGRFFQQRIMNGQTSPVRIPANLAPGNYMLRHEIIALHLAPNNPGGTEFYPSCTQLVVTGSGTGRPRSQDTVTFPGGYRASEPGFSKNIFSGNYQIPGPAIAQLVSGGGASNPTTTVRGATTTTARPNSTTATPKPTKSSGSCKLRRRETVETIADDDEEFETIVIRRPRQHSRVMKRLAKEDTIH